MFLQNTKQPSDPPLSYAFCTNPPPPPFNVVQSAVSTCIRPASMQALQFGFHISVECEGQSCEFRAIPRI